MCHDLSGEEGKGGNLCEKEGYGSFVLVLEVTWLPRAHVEKDRGVFQFGGRMDIEEDTTADAHLLLRLVGDLAMRRGVRSYGSEGLAISSTHAFS